MEAKEQLKNYIKLVDEAILINNADVMFGFCWKNTMLNGLCSFTCGNKIIANRGRRIIKRNYLRIYEPLFPNYGSFWFGLTVNSIYDVSLSLAKDSLLARQQVCKDILEIYYPNSFKQLILNLWKRY
jgi:hypothetical protein